MRERVWATWSKVLWLSLQTITRQLPPRSEPGPPVRGRSIVLVDIAREVWPWNHGADSLLPALVRAGDADDDVVDAGDDAVAVLDRADDGGGGAAGEVAGTLVFGFADEFVADIGEEPGLAPFGAAGDVDGAQSQLVRLVDADDGFLVLGDRQVLGPVLRHLDQLRLALARKDQQRVFCAAAGAQHQAEVGLALQRRRGAAEQALGGGDLEVAAEHGGAVGAGAGRLADRDPHRSTHAGASAGLAGELDQLAALGKRLHAVAV